MSNKKDDVEIKSLNLENLDVEELEHRLEMAVAAPDSCYSFSCGTNAICASRSVEQV